MKTDSSAIRVSMLWGLIGINFFGDRMKSTSFFIWSASLVGLVGLSIVSTSCCMRDPFETPLSKAFEHLGTKDNHWLYVRISPVDGETRLRHFVICRFLEENKWVVRLDGQYTLYKKNCGAYESRSINTNRLAIAQEPKGEPCRMCKVGEETARFLDVDGLKAMLKQVDRVVIDDGELGFFLTIPQTESFWYWESVTFRSGGGDLIKEAETMALLLHGLNGKE